MQGISRSGFLSGNSLTIGAATLVAVVAVLLLIGFVDVPLARFADHHLNSARWLFRVLAIVAGLPLVIVLALCAISVKAVRFMPRGLALSARLGAIAAVLAYLVNDHMLKPVFGRADIQTMKMGGGAGFHFFHSGLGYMSFPSGHMAVVSAVLVVIALLQPRYGRWCIVVAIAIATALVGAQWHFASDILAGGMVGSAIGALVITGSKAFRRWRNRDGDPVLAENAAEGAA